MHRLLVLGAALVVALVLSGVAGAWSWPADGQVLRVFELGADTYAAGQHRGIDVAGAPGSPIRAPAAGTVTFAGSVPTHGRGVTILTADGYSVTLFHLESVEVAKGDAVDEGAPVGTMGSSGEAEHSVPTVHLGIRVAERQDGYVDPVGLLPERPSAPASPAPAPVPAPAAVPAPVPTAPPPPVVQPPPPPPTPSAPTPIPPPVTPVVPAPSAPAAAAPVTASPPAVAPPVPSEPVRVSAPEAPPPSRADTAIGEVVGIREPSGASPGDKILGGTTRSASGALSEPALAAGDLVVLAPRGDGRTGRSGAEVRSHAAAELLGRPDRAAGPRGGDVAAPTGVQGDRAVTRGKAESGARPTATRFAGRDERELTPVQPDRAHPVDATSDEAAVAQGRRPALGELARGPGSLPASVEVRGPGTGLGLAELLAALTLAGLVAARVAMKAARRIERDGAVLPDDADLLRQLDAAHRPCLHDGRGRRVRASSAAARS